MDKYRDMSREIGEILESRTKESQVQLSAVASASASALVADMRARCKTYNSQAFLRELRSELETWVNDLQSVILTTPPPTNRSNAAANARSINPIVPEQPTYDVDIQWTMFDDDWFEIGDQTRLRVQGGVPIEIETFSINLNDAVTTAENVCARQLYLVGEWVHHENGRSTALVAVAT